MTHGLNNRYLYSAKKVVATWTDGAIDVESQGTGFFIEKDSNAILVTNRHVVEPGYSNIKYKGFTMKGFKVESYASFDSMGFPEKINSTEITNWKDFVFHENICNDVACLINVETVNDIYINSPIPYEMLATSEWIANKLVVCDTIAYPGFPQWYDHQNNTPIFRMGTIASDPRFDYSYDKSAPIAQRIAYEGFSSGGASGSPVFAVQRGFGIGKGLEGPEGFYREVKLIGINAGHFEDNVGHSGISYLYKASVIHDIID